ncbi:MAG: hypothetical protein IJF75_07525 [Clostridia bacterium]|nr:hypothetical protein [Clostridia bacterium]
MKTVLNEEKEMFFMCLWILPLIPIIAIFILALVNNSFSWLLILVFILWFIVFGYIYYCNHCVIIFEEKNFIIKQKNNKQVIQYSNVILIEEIRYSSALRTNKYKIHLKENCLSEKKVFVTSNKIIQRKIKDIFKNTEIKVGTVVD